MDQHSTKRVASTGCVELPAAGRLLTFLAGQDEIAARALEDTLGASLTNSEKSFVLGKLGVFQLHWQNRTFEFRRSKRETWDPWTRE